MDFGVPVKCVKEILRYRKPVRCASAPAFIDGFMGLREMQVPVLDLRRRFELDSGAADPAMAIIVTVEGRIVALAVDEVRGLALGTKELRLSPEGRGLRRGEGAVRPWAACVDSAFEAEGGSVLIIDPAAILSEEEKALLDGPALGV